MAKKHTWLCLQLLALLITLAGCTADEQLKETQIQKDRGLFVINASSKTTEEDIEWEKTFGGNNSDVGSSVRQTSDGGYIIVGSTSSYGARKSNVYLIKTNFISQDRVSTPAFKSPGGLFEESVDVDIACDTHDATIRYTTDGSTPSSSVGVIYDGTPIHLTKTTTIKAIAFKDGMIDSVSPLKLYEKKKY